MIAVCRLRYCPETRAYAQRRTTEGKTKKEIIRCLKRYIARQAYATLRDDLRLLPRLDIYRNVPGRLIATGHCQFRCVSGCGCHRFQSIGLPAMRSP